MGRVELYSSLEKKGNKTGTARVSLCHREEGNTAYPSRVPASGGGVAAGLRCVLRNQYRMCRSPGDRRLRSERKNARRRETLPPRNPARSVFLPVLFSWRCACEALRVSPGDK